MLCSCKNSNFSFLFQLNSNISTQSPLCQTPLLSKMYWLLKSHGWFCSFFHKLPSQISNLSLCWGCLLFSNTFPLVVIPQISGNLQRKSLTASSITTTPSNCTSCFSAFSTEQNTSPASQAALRSAVSENPGFRCGLESE